MRMIKVDFFMEGKFAKLNKRSTLQQYIEECDYLHKDANGFNVDRCKVTEIWVMSDKEWYETTNSFLDENDELYGEKGGTGSTWQAPEHKKEIYELTEEELSLWHKGVYRMCILLYNEKTYESCLVDPQGYDYARYVGLPIWSVMTVQTIYNTGYRDCALKGATAYAEQLYILVDKGQSNITLDRINLDLLFVVKDSGFGTLKAVPLAANKRTMMGGNFIYSSDSRFRKINEYPIPVHDRVEG